ncbi:MAG: tyrosine-type recombinase/integrase [Planctomycetaceae bacterium]
MATLTTDRKTGLRSIRYIEGAKRPKIALGRMKVKAAQGVLVRIEDLIFAKQSRTSASPQTAEWVSSLEGKLRERLQELGLIQSLATDDENKPGAGMTLAVFLDDFIARRNDTSKPATLIVYGHTRRCLVDKFGADKPLSEITTGDAKDWRMWLKSNEKLAENTIRRRVGFAKQFFKDATEHEYIVKNPFDALKGVSIHGDPEKFYFITEDEARKVMEACPNAEWRLLFALSRWGGLRCPSEHFALKWSDINWAENKIVVRSPKTEHLRGKAYRTMPLFPELLKPLQDVWEQTKPGTEYVINRYRDAKQNLRTQLTRIIISAGLTPWVKLFHNLRASRETELSQHHPIHVVCDWIGNSPRIAAEHYLRTTDGDFEKALGARGQNRGQQATEMSEPTAKEGNEPKSLNEKTPVLHRVRKDFTRIHCSKVDDIGLEPTTSTMSTDFCCLAILRETSVNVGYTPSRHCFNITHDFSAFFTAFRGKW